MPSDCRRLVSGNLTFVSGWIAVPVGVSALRLTRLGLSPVGREVSDE